VSGTALLVTRFVTGVRWGNRNWERDYHECRSPVTDGHEVRQGSARWHGHGGAMYQVCGDTVGRHTTDLQIEDSGYVGRCCW
jgi:hypothetical protein